MTASARLQTASLFAGYGVAGLFWGAFAAAAPALQDRAGLTEAGYGIALGLMALAAFPVMRAFGHSLHRFERYAIPGCLGAFALGSLVMGIAPGLPGLIFALLITGASSGALDISLNNRAARIEADTGARLFNRAHALFPAAMLAASAVTGFLRGAGVPLPVVFGGVAVAFALVAMIEFRAGGHVRPHPDDTAAKGRSRLVGAFAILAAIAAAGAFQEAAALSWVAIFVERVQAAGPVLAGLAPAAFTLGLSLGRFGAHELEARLRPIITVRLAALLALPAFAVIAMGVPVPVTLAACLLAGIGVGPIEPAVFRAVATRAQGPERGRALASVTAVAYLGYLLSPPALGVVADYLGWPVMWLAVSLLAALVVALTARMPRA
ncbi:MAG: MFS transporter [Rhodobacteraceae bacterium]|nr:MFS transporter [Paracoccaceae bacterium]